jgi:hypothetical protein
MSQRLIDTSFDDLKGRGMAVTRVRQNDAQHLLTKKLHIVAGSIRLTPDCRVLRTGVLGFGYGGHVQSSYNRLSRTPSGQANKNHRLTP